MTNWFYRRILPLINTESVFLLTRTVVSSQPIARAAWFKWNGSQVLVCPDRLGQTFRLNTLWM